MTTYILTGLADAAFLIWHGPIPQDGIVGVKTSGISNARLRSVPSPRSTTTGRSTGHLAALFNFIQMRVLMRPGKSQIEQMDSTLEARRPARFTFDIKILAWSIRTAVEGKDGPNYST
jgi:hypothetical protein